MNDFKQFLRVVGIALYALLTIATCAGVWNFCPETFIKVLAGALFCANAFIIYRFVKKLKAERDKE